jgi:hypothetical protein
MPPATSMSTPRSVLGLFVMVAGCHVTVTDPNGSHAAPQASSPSASPPLTASVPTTPTPPQPDPSAQTTCSWVEVENCAASNFEQHIVRHDIVRGDALVLLAGRSGAPDASGQARSVRDDRGTPHTLIIGGEEDVTWTVAAAHPEAIRQIIVMGSGAQAVQGPAGVPTRVLTFDRSSFPGVPFLPSVDLDRDPSLDGVRAGTGLTVDEIGGCSTGIAPWAPVAGAPNFVVRADPVCVPRTDAVTTPVGAPMSWREGVFQGGSPHAIDGDEVSPWPGMTSADVFAVHSHDAGKFYFEYQLAQWPTADGTQGFGLASWPTPVPSNYAFSDYGFKLPMGEGYGHSGFTGHPFQIREHFSAGQRIGVAVDLDEGFAYVSVDGTWTEGYPEAYMRVPLTRPATTPGGSPGYAIPRYTAFAPMVHLAAGTTVDIITAPDKMRFGAPAGFVAGW